MAFFQSTNLCGNRTAFYPPASAMPRHPHNGQGGFGLCNHFHRGNDTGRVREVTNRRRFPCEIDTGGTPACEIVSGHCPQGSLVKGGWQKSLIFD